MDGSGGTATQKCTQSGALQTLSTASSQKASQINRLRNGSQARAPGTEPEQYASP